MSLESKSVKPLAVLPSVDDLQTGQMWLINITSGKTGEVRPPEVRLCEIIDVAADNAVIRIKLDGLTAGWVAPDDLIQTIVGYYGIRKRVLFGLFSYVSKDPEWYGKED